MFLSPTPTFNNRNEKDAGKHEKKQQRASQINSISFFVSFILIFLLLLCENLREKKSFRNLLASFIAGVVQNACQINNFKLNY